MKANLAPRLVAIGLLCCGIALLALDFRATFEIPAHKAIAGAGHEYAIYKVPVPFALDFPGDENLHPKRSVLQLFENGVQIGPAHSAHEDIRKLGGGRYSHWGAGLLFSASDNTDPTANGRVYSVAYPVALPPWIGYLCLLTGLALLLYSDRKAWALSLRDAAGTITHCVARVRGAEAFSAWSLVQLALFAGLLGCSLFLGFERSGWILVTQPVEPFSAANSLLGYSLVREGSVLHIENYSSFLQVAYFSGAEVTPDLYFRRPVYAFFAALLAPAFGVAAALFLVNAIAWCLAIWLCYRFTRNFYGDRDAARWASLFAITGIGFVVHAMDLSAHLLSFVFYMGGVVLIHESQVWRKAVELPAHLGIAAFLMLACLQYNTGIALVAAYFVVAIRHNRLRHVLPVCVLAILMQPLWGRIVGSLFEARHGMALPDLSQTEYEYLQRAISAWIVIFQKPPVEMISSVAGLMSSFLFFEMPLVTLIGAAGMLADRGADANGRARFAFSLPFIGFPVLAALVFAPAAGARGYLIYGISLFFIASCGTVLARLVRQKPAVFFPLACLVVVISLAWSTAHFANVLGPGKAYFLGMNHASHLFGMPGWEAASLTGLEPTPRLFGGSATLSEAGLSPFLPAIAIPEATSVPYALYAGGLFVVLVGALLIFAAGRNWRMGLLAASILLSALALCGRLVENDVRVARIDKVYRLEPGNFVTYEVDLSDRVRAKLIDGLRGGHVVTLLPGFYSGPVPPAVRIGGRPARLLGKVNSRIWLFDSPGLLASLTSAGGGKFEITFTGGEDTWIGGWQRVGLPGRLLTSKQSIDESVVLPSLEIRLVRDSASLVPLFVGF